MGSVDKEVSPVRWFNLPRITEYVRLDETDAQRDSGRYVPSLSLRENRYPVFTVYSREPTDRCPNCEFRGGGSITLENSSLKVG